jgi:hypothetical protein
MTLTSEHLGFVARYTYVAQSTLACNDHSILITGSGTRATGSANIDLAMKVAIEHAVLDTAQKALQARRQLCPPKST